MLRRINRFVIFQQKSALRTLFLWLWRINMWSESPLETRSNRIVARKNPSLLGWRIEHTDSFSSGNISQKIVSREEFHVVGSCELTIGAPGSTLVCVQVQTARENYPTICRYSEFYLFRIGDLSGWDVRMSQFTGKTVQVLLALLNFWLEISFRASVFWEISFQMGLEKCPRR